MGLYLGQDKIAKLFLGTDEISKIYLGEDVIYSSAPTLLYENDISKLSVQAGNAWFNGISWSGNLLTRPQYTASSVTNYSFNNVTTDGVMKLNVGENSGGSLSYNSHVCTTRKVVIPYGVTKLRVMVDRSAATGTYLKIGLLPDEATNSMDTSHGGVMVTHSPTYGTAIYDVDLASGMNGSNLYRPVINIQGPRSANYSVFTIYKVWFA